MTSKLFTSAVILLAAASGEDLNSSLGSLGALFPSAEDVSAESIVVGQTVAGRFGAGGKPHKIFSPTIVAKPNKDERNIQTASCVINAIQAAQYLAIAGLQIKGSTNDCVDGGNPRNVCAANIAGIIAAFSGVASFLSACAASCGEIANAKAGCASNIAGLIDGIAELVQAGNSLSTTCPTATSFEGAGVTGRRLHSSNITDGRRMESITPDAMASCIIDGSVAAGWLSKAGVQIKAAIGGCDPDSDQQICAANVMGIFGSFVTAGSFIAPMAQLCATNVNPGAVCAADIQQLIANLNNVAQASITMKYSCNPDEW